MIILNYTHNDILKERRFFVSNFDIDFNFMVFFDSTVRYGESPWGRGRRGACIRALTPHWRVCSSPGCYNTPRLRWCAPNSPAVPVRLSNSTPKYTSSLTVLTIFFQKCQDLPVLWFHLILVGINFRGFNENFSFKDTQVCCQLSYQYKMLVKFTL